MHKELIDASVHFIVKYQKRHLLQYMGTTQGSYQINFPKKLKKSLTVKVHFSTSSDHPMKEKIFLSHSLSSPQPSNKKEDFFPRIP